MTVDKSYIIDFIFFLRKNNLSEFTVRTYFNIVNAALNKACREGLIHKNPTSEMEMNQRPKKPESEREYLTMDEVKLLAQTECKRTVVKRAFLFSCFTGLRLSDVEALRWEEIQKDGGQYQLEARQTKTGTLVYIPLSANALAQLPPVFPTQGKVFALPSRGTIRRFLSNWVKRAGIRKHITFHCSRHTYATLLISYGANLYTVSSLLGHTNISTTQIYAKIIDENKRKTVNLIPDIAAGEI